MNQIRDPHGATIARACPAHAFPADHVRAGRCPCPGHVTICLAPGEEVGWNAAANDQGGSHTWTMGC
ncbi:hypothetical protein AV521_03935 [Streptomyces sp. IMTB 2501]|nr:hypothetical protein AV521_03935 [Streptomyces sp. IMTB 2501]